MLSNKYNKTDCPMPSNISWVENLNNLVKTGQAKVFIFDVGRPFGDISREEDDNAC
ncbi:MAG: hypothetical protein HRT87_06575 [Legionellales bacterium]|nr:hypothetical protein [Legionellales bacterium]